MMVRMRCNVGVKILTRGWSALLLLLSLRKHGSSGRVDAFEEVQLDR